MVRASIVTAATPTESADLAGLRGRWPVRCADTLVAGDDRGQHLDGAENSGAFQSAWTRWFGVGMWTSGTDSLERHNVDAQEEGSWRVLTDSLQTAEHVFAKAYRYPLTLFTEEWGVSPSVHSVCCVVSDSCCHGEYLRVRATGAFGVGSSRCQHARRRCTRTLARLGTVRSRSR